MTWNFEDEDDQALRLHAAYQRLIGGRVVVRQKREMREQFASIHWFTLVKPMGLHVSFPLLCLLVPVLSVLRQPAR